MVGFTSTSILCGLSFNLEELILFRMLQGAFGAALQPMGQATMLDMNPPPRQAQAMAVYSMGVVLGPVLGPTIGGWLTDNLDWRWVFFINLPVGLIAATGILFFMVETKGASPRRFDMFGFIVLSLAVTSFQLMLDRGQMQDWFDSREIWLEASGALFFGYLFVVHVLTTENPFVDLSIFTDRNFLAAAIFIFLLSVMIFGALALLPPLLEGLMGYPVVLTGFVTAPRGLGTMLSMIVSAPILKRFDPRLVVLVGFGFSTYSVWAMSGFSLGMDTSLIVRSGFLQGIGTGLIFVALTVTAFGTLPGRLRNEGVAMFTLIRSMGSATGISILELLTSRAAATVHARLVEGVRPDNPVLARAVPGFDFQSPAVVAGMNAEITRQAVMVSYTDAFWIMFVGSLVSLPLVLLLKPPRRVVAPDPQIHIE